MRVSVSCPTKFHAFYLAEQLYKRGCLSRLYTSFFGRFGNRRNNVNIDLPRRRVITNIPAAFLYYAFNPGGDLFRGRYFGKWVAERLDDEDLVCTWGLSALPIIEKAHSLGIKVLLERGSSHAVFQRDILLEEYERWGTSTRELRRSFSQARMDLELEEYEKADFIGIPSSFVERTFLANEIEREKLIRVPYGVSLGEFPQIPRTDKTFRVIFAGSMSLRKGVQYLLQAFSELDLPNAELWLVGGKLPEIDPFFRKYEGVFRYFGHQPQSRLHEYYSQCSVFVLCSIEDGLGMVLTQAMACGLPLISTPNCGGEDLFRDGREGFIVPIRGVKRLKEKIQYFYENRETCHEMGVAARRRAEGHFSWDDYGANVVRAYGEALAR